MTTTDSAALGQRDLGACDQSNDVESVMGGETGNDWSGAEAALLRARRAEAERDEARAARVMKLDAMRAGGDAIDRVHAAFGAPGDWGDGTPKGDALAALYRARMNLFAEATDAAARPDDPWFWYVAPDDDSEVWTHATGCATREDAIGFGRVEYCGASFAICEARHGHFDLGLNADLLEEIVLDRSVGRLGEDQYAIFVYPDVVGERREARRERLRSINAALAAYIERAARAWAAAHGVTIARPENFAQVRAQENIDEAAADGAQV